LEIAMRTTRRIPTSQSRRTRVYALFVLAGCAALPSIAQAEAKRLVLDPPVNKPYHYKLDTEQEANMQGAVFTTSMAAEATLTRVAGPKSDNLFVDVLFTKVEGSMKQGDKLEPLPIELDGKKARAEVTPQGKVVRVEAPEGSTPEEKRIYENLVDAFFIELPAKPVSVDDTWKISLGKPAEGREGEGEFTLEKIEKKKGIDCAHLNGTVHMQSKEPPLKGKGTIESDVATTGGFIVAAKGEVTVETSGPTVVQSFELKLLD
jgi:hypothetical protein